MKEDAVELGIKEEDIEFAIKLHGHLSPGVALGMRMVEIAYKYLGTNKRGKGITGVAETRMCIPDALQVMAGTTPGNKNLIVLDYGKLALSVILYEERVGYRVSLRKDASETSHSLKKFMYKLGRLGHDEEEKLANTLLKLDERYFDVKKIRITIPLADEKTPIAECQICHELQPEKYVVAENGRIICMVCKGDSYFEALD
jgi:formylmethanofuran dehydrogenase subunit E